MFGPARLLGSLLERLFARRAATKPVEARDARGHDLGIAARVLPLSFLVGRVEEDCD
jgi:hypothetical protein